MVPLILFLLMVSLIHFIINLNPNYINKKAIRHAYGINNYRVTRMKHGASGGVIEVVTRYVQVELVHEHKLMNESIE